MLDASDNGRKINVWSTNKYSNELHTSVSVAFSVPSSMQSDALHWRRYAECCRNCSMQFIWIFIGAPNVDFSPIITCAKHRLTLWCMVLILCRLSFDVDIFDNFFGLDKSGECCTNKTSLTQAQVTSPAACHHIPFHF